MKLIIDMPENWEEQISYMFDEEMAHLLYIKFMNAIPLDKIRAEIDKRKSTIDKAISEDELKIEGLKEAYTDCLEIIDKYRAESEE